VGDKDMKDSLFDLTGRVAIVTGASSGLGVQFAKALANAGANVTIAARRIEKLEALEKELEKTGVECLAVKCDVLIEEDVVNYHPMNRVASCFIIESNDSIPQA